MGTVKLLDRAKGRRTPPQGVRKPDFKNQDAVKKKRRSYKDRIRGLERLLKKPGLDPRARAKKQTELEDLKQAAAQNHKADKERKNAQRYHKVKFFERVKIERRLQKLERKQRQHGLTDQEQQLLQDLQDDLLYVKHFPNSHKYVSLFKNASTPEAQQQLEVSRVQLRALIKANLAEVALVTEADEGRGKDTGQQQQAHASHRSKSVAQMASMAGHDSESDDFFLGEDSGKEEAVNTGALYGSPPVAAPQKRKQFPEVEPSDTKHRRLHSHKDAGTALAVAAVRAVGQHCARDTVPGKAVEQLATQAAVAGRQPVGKHSCQLDENEDLSSDSQDGSDAGDGEQGGGGREDEDNGEEDRREQDGGVGMGLGEDHNFFAHGGDDVVDHYDEKGAEENGKEGEESSAEEDKSQEEEGEDKKVGLGGYALEEYTSDDSDGQIAKVDNTNDNNDKRKLVGKGKFDGRQLPHGNNLHSSSPYQRNHNGWATRGARWRGGNGPFRQSEHRPSSAAGSSQQCKQQAQQPGNVLRKPPSRSQAGFSEDQKPHGRPYSSKPPSNGACLPSAAMPQRTQSIKPGGAKGGKAGGKRGKAGPKAAAQPLRSRAEGGRKRRKKK